LSNFSLSLRKLEKLKAWKNRNVPIYLFHASVNIENCIGLRKKFLGLGLIISVRISSAEVFVLHWSKRRKIDGSTVLFLRKVREWRLQINNIPAPKQCKNFTQILPHKETV